MTDVDTPSPTEAARDSAAAIGALPSLFMFDAATYGAGASVGYEGISFYFCGRGGALGDVDAATVAEAFTFFYPDTVAEAWNSGSAIEARSEACRRWAATAAAWARDHLTEGALDYGRLAELAGRVVESADTQGAPVFAGWKELPVPEDPRAAALHQLNALRELRNARHAEAVAAVGLTPLEAVMVRSPHMIGIYGWPEPHPVPDDEMRTCWQSAEDATDERFGKDLAVLSGAERAELVELANAALAAAH